MERGESQPDGFGRTERKEREWASAHDRLRLRSSEIADRKVRRFAENPKGAPASLGFLACCAVGYRAHMAWPEDALSHDEEIITSFRPHWKLLFVPFLWFVLFLVVASGIGIVFDGIGLWLLVIVAALAIWFVAKPLVAWATTRYVLTTERLITRKGLIAKSGIEIPLERITNVNFSQTVFERMLGAGDLLVESAGTTGQSEFKDIPHPDDFQSLLYKVREQRSIALSGSSPAPAKDHAESIRDLARLRDEGLISEAEYETKRRELLEDM